MEDKVSFAWWNTGLSPSKARDRASPEEITFAFSQIAKIIKDYDIDIFCLGEISPNDLANLSSLYSSIGYSIFDGTFDEGLMKHDLCVLIKDEKFLLIDSKSITEQSLLGKIRAGHELQLIHINSEDVFYLYISHWPARLHDKNKGMPKRYDLGKTLRNAIQRCIDNNQGKYLILIGDYNDEPFDESLTEALVATRDRQLVLKKSDFIYNPFWRHLGSSLMFPETNHEDSTFGTYYHNKGDTTKWLTFDQIMFSSSFVKHSDWHLIEEDVRILNDDELRKLVINNKTVFDHLPVLASVKRI